MPPRPSRGLPESFIRSLSIDRAAIADPAAYPFSIPALAGLGELELDPHVTFLAGANAAAFFLRGRASFAPSHAGSLEEGKPRRA